MKNRKLANIQHSARQVTRIIRATAYHPCEDYYFKKLIHWLRR